MMSDTGKLYASFRDGGDCKEPLPQTEVAALVAPLEIKEMLQLSREWHLLQAGVSRTICIPLPLPHNSCN